MKIIRFETGTETETTKLLKLFLLQCILENLNMYNERLEPPHNTHSDSFHFGRKMFIYMKKQ